MKSDDIKELNEIEKQSLRVLYKTKTVFPFRFFPEEIIVDELKVTIKRHGIPGVVDVFPIKLENLLTVSVNTSIFFGSIQFDLTNYEQNPEPVEFLPKGDALELHKLLTGLVFLKKSEIDISGINSTELFNRATTIGADHA